MEYGSEMRHDAAAVKVAQVYCQGLLSLEGITLGVSRNEKFGKLTSLLLLPCHYL